MAIISFGVDLHVLDVADAIGQLHRDDILDLFVSVDNNVCDLGFTLDVVETFMKIAIGEDGDSKQILNKIKQMVLELENE